MLMCVCRILIKITYLLTYLLNLPNHHIFFIFGPVVELRKSSGDDTETPKAPRLRRRVLHGVRNRSGGIPHHPGNSSTAAS